ncbi:MAG TPA: TlpA disulfide reductase family protein [Acidimicrobiales bacterium]|nr:TlpA disulfide reductase family protein [Acidimicrobiales bacterium]
MTFEEGGPSAGDLADGDPSSGAAAGDLPRPVPHRKRRGLPARFRVMIGVATIGVIVLVSLVTALSVMSRQAKARPFSLPPVRGTGTVDLASPPGRPVVLNFFGSWCAPCRQELPLLSEASRTHGAEVRFVGVDLEDQKGPAAAMLDQYGITYQAGFDPGDRVASLYGLRGTPTTFFIAADGRIVATAAGAMNAKEFQDDLKQLLAAGR